MPTRLVAADEGLSPDSLTSCPAILHTEILPPALRPPAHKPDFIRFLEPRYVGHTNGRRRYSSIKKIQIGKWKYCTDHNLSHTAQMIRAKYAPSPLPSANTFKVPKSTSFPSSRAARAHHTHPPSQVSPPFSPSAPTLLTLMLVLWYMYEVRWVMKCSRG
jgi:hypothetical protein